MSIPKEHTGIYYIWTAIKANVGITYWDVKNGLVGWGDIFAVMDGERLMGWLEWEQHCRAEQEAQRKRG